MTNQDFYEFQTTVEGSAVSFENQKDGSTVVTCADGVRILVAVDGESFESVLTALRQDFRPGGIAGVDQRDHVGRQISAIPEVAGAAQDAAVEAALADEETLLEEEAAAGWPAPPPQKTWEEIE